MTMDMPGSGTMSTPFWEFGLLAWLIRRMLIMMKIEPKLMNLKELVSSV